MKSSIPDELSSNTSINTKSEITVNTSTANLITNTNEDTPVTKESEKLLDPFCHYNTSLNS